MAILAGFLYLATANLDYARLWGDEAIQMFIARNFAAFGEPLVFDGRSFYTNDPRGETLDVTPDLHHRYPQFVYYFGWAAVKLFGDTETAGRLACALAGFLAMLIFWRILAREFSGRPFLIAAALAFACFSPMTLLHVRQFQYYAPALLFAVAVFYFYLRYLDDKKLRRLAGMVAAALLLFHSHYLVAAAFAATLALFHIAFRADCFNRRDWIRFAAAAALWAGLGALYLWHSGHLAELAGYERHRQHPFLQRHALLIWTHLRALNESGILPWTAAAWLLYAAAKTGAWRAAARDKTIQYGFAAVVFAAAAGALTPDPVLKWAHARYLIAAVPFAAVACAAAVEWTIQKTNRFWGGLLLAAALSSNIAAAPFANHVYYGSKPVFTLPALVLEFHRPYRSGMDASLQYMQSHAAQDDVVLIRPFYYANPVRYYLGDKLKICCMLSRNSPHYPRFAKSHPWLVSETARPGWIVSYGGALSAAELGALKPFGSYRLHVTLPVFEPGFSLQRPEPALHLYSHSLPEFARANPDQQVYIYRRQ